MTGDKKFFRCCYVYVLFAVAFIALFVSQSKKTGFDNYPHGYLSAHGMALSENLFKTHNIFMFNSASISDGKISYDAYNRFPPLSFLLIKGATFFSDNYNMRIYSARQLMHVFFVLSFVFVFLMCKLFSKDSALAFACSCLVFSSFYYLHYSNMIFSDIPSLCFFTGALYFALSIGRGKIINTGLLLLFVVLSALTGWQSGAVFSLWVFIDFVKWLMKKDNSLKTSCLCFFVFSFISVGVFGLQLYYEACALDVSFMSLPTVKSVLFRLGLAGDAVYFSYEGRQSYLYFIVKESFRIIRLLFPVSLELYWSLLTRAVKMIYIFYFLLVGILFILLLKCKNKIIKTDEIILLLFSGFFWTLPMKMHVAFHDFQSIFYVGIPVCFYVLVCSLVKTKKFLLVNLTFLLLLVNMFASSANKASLQKEAAVISKEFDSIRKQLPKGAKVYLASNDVLEKIGETTGAHPVHAIDYYLSGCFYTNKEQADYAIATGILYNRKKLTDNVYVNLFDNRG